MGAIGGDELERLENQETEMDEMAGEGRGGNVEKILVSVRLRPLSEREIAKGDPADWECINDTTIIFRNSLTDRAMAPTAHSFDRVFRSDCTTKEVYEHGAKNVALSVVSGINASIFAYGQTSSGKTYTMTGITEYAVADIYDYMRKHEERAFVLKFSALEIYNEVVRDLLCAENVPLRLLDDPEKGTVVENLTEEVLRDMNHLWKLISVCEAHRRVAETYLNEASSRSHQILRLTIESYACELVGADNLSKLIASVNFVDLAGSERASQALSAGARLKEGCHINRSLLTLGSVIRKLSKGRNGHVPYRDSKLTRILQSSLGGNARTAIICTMSPARSHIEQSRNTLFFASCAKEVTTNAQVNVVMSDKALVKHLQRELARLESELRFPASSNSSLESLLRERDARIKKMESEIKELKRQRDLAESCLQDLLHSFEGHHVENRRMRTNFTAVPFSCEDEQSASESSEVVDPKPNFRFRPPAYSGGSPSFGILLPSNGKQSSFEDSDELCREVRCIEVNESTSECSNVTSAEGSNGRGLISNSTPQGVVEDANLPVNSLLSGIPPVTLEQHLQNVRRPLFRGNCDSTPLWSTNQHSCTSKDPMLGRSRSCRSTMTISSTWFGETEQNGSTPISTNFIKFPGRTAGQQSRSDVLDYDAESSILSRGESRHSDCSTPINKNGTSASEMEFAGISHFVAELKEMAQDQYDKQLISGQKLGDEGTIKSLGLGPIVDVMQSPSRWPSEFEKKQQEIIDLWHECNVSLLHRTYFFLLFRGDPADSIYMEVELRRLLFLKNTYFCNAIKRSSSQAISMKQLRRERDMLCRQMQRRLSVQERESTYVKWGVSVNSKRRRMQVVRRLWMETKDLEHVRESASLIAKLIGLLEPGQALKEMFGLSFAPQQLQSDKRFHGGWRHRSGMLPFN